MLTCAIAAPLAAVRRDACEAWEHTAAPEGDEKPYSAEELWEPQKIENPGEDSFT